MAIPVVVAPYGFPVRPVDANAPEMIVAKNGIGTPIMITDLGTPFIVRGLAGTPPSGTLEGHITVGFDSDFGFYGFSDGSFVPAFGSASGPASADLMAFVWAPGTGGSVVFTTAAFAGGYLHFSGESVLLETQGSEIEANLTPEQTVGWPTSGTHPFYVELP